MRKPCSKTLRDLGPDPPAYPSVWYHLAECRRRRGDTLGGRELDQRAASTNLGTRWERLARERLEQEGCAHRMTAC